MLAQQTGLTTGGWTVMILCVGLVTSLMLYCYYRILSEPRPSEHHHAPLEIDTHDSDD